MFTLFTVNSTLESCAILTTKQTKSFQLPTVPAATTWQKQHQHLLQWTGSLKGWMQPPLMELSWQDNPLPSFSLTAIRKLWGDGDYQAEIDDIMKEKGAVASTKTLRVLEVIKERSLRWQLYVLMIVMTTLQLCGINAVECSLYPQDKRGSITNFWKTMLLNQLRIVSQMQHLFSQINFLSAFFRYTSILLKYSIQPSLKNTLSHTCPWELGCVSAYPPYCV